MFPVLVASFVGWIRPDSAIGAVFSLAAPVRSDLALKPLAHREKKIAHSILDHPVLVLWLSGRVSGLLAGGAWVLWRALPWSCCVLLLLVILDLRL